MPKKIVLIAGVVVLLISGVVAFMLLGKSSKTTDKTAIGQELSAPAESTTKSSLKGLVAAGKNVTCTFKYEADNNATDGTVYVAGEKVRSDFAVKTPDGKNMESHMIQDADYNYFWSSAMPTGTKMKISDTAQASPSPSSDAQTTDLNREMDMKCSAWSVDDSKFAVPANIKFMEISAPALKTQPQSNSTDTQVPAGSICDQIQDPAGKAECLKSLGGSGY